MQSDVKESADAIEKNIKKTLENYLKRGKEIEQNIIARKKEKENLRQDEKSPFHLLGMAAKAIAGGQKSKEKKSSNQNEIIANAKNGIVTFDEKTVANNFRGEIEESILKVMKEARKFSKIY